MAAFPKGTNDVVPSQCMPRMGVTRSGARETKMCGRIQSIWAER